ncbi:pentatricopeptide repeat-containing protein mitochondrial-like [Dorcoceras hygrometricum]|uniref:Pentatricopeptide repeat-containing protein mitochondrial-like n=1 Tax=Dorcoceras hygrometricum TaxID=472368 RepID=A0A2Z7CLD0_9LAMI|nr:pentatricopeptide repeat-containing protein mitochondrial-like [Dorcoceras hygrometricum]
MASSYYTNTLHVNFESVLAMDDPGMVSMFQALMASGLEGFFGCPAVIYEAALVDFFDNASVRDVIPKDSVADARSIVSSSGEPISMYGKKREMKFEYRLLCDIMAKTISVKAGSFNAITMEKFLMLTAIVYGVRIKWTSILFNILKKMVTLGSKQAKGYAVQISLLTRKFSKPGTGRIFGVSLFKDSNRQDSSSLHCSE